MILVESIDIEEFRGIRKISLDLKGKNFTVCGSNGTGKSGIVDALEFALTGNISRLSGEGRGEISLKQHGPHVDKRNDPEKANVTVNLLIPTLGKRVTLKRNLKNPANPEVTPNDPEITSILEHVKAHPEIVLSRRELIRYVLATPGKRAEEVQSLLHLDQVEQVRVNLQKIANSCEKLLPNLKLSVTQERDKSLRDLGLSEMTKDKIIAATNAQRLILGLPALTDLSPTVSLKDGMSTPSPTTPQRISKSQALTDIRAVREAFAEITGDVITKCVDDLRNSLVSISSDPMIVSSMKREALFSTGLDLIDEEICPLCDTPWDLKELKSHIQAKIKHLKDVSLIRKDADGKIATLIATLQKAQLSSAVLINYGNLTTPTIATNGLQCHIKIIKSIINKLSVFFPIKESIDSLAITQNIPQNALDEISAIEKIITGLPEPTKQDAAREWLTIAHERIEAFREAKRKYLIADNQAKRTRQISDIYTKTSDDILASLYKAVEKILVEFYGFVNRDDEKNFNAKLIPSMGKLGFDVDFYGRGYFPPGAYHSEGHQDSMGLCLYLALMKHLHGDSFTFAVLDDVLMSVDSAHRREVCALLKKNFPNTQFIMTTHDPIWLRHMKTEGLIDSRASVHFREWSVDQGPIQWDQRDVWKEIDDYLKINDVRSAAALLRHYLEYESAELCHRLRAPVGFRGDALYQLGELLPAATARLRHLYKKAKESANSWNKRDVVDQIEKRELDLNRLITTSNLEQWQVNVAVHFNSWDNLDKNEFSPVVSSFKELLAGFRCDKCGSYLRISPDRETPEFISCDCSDINYNLLLKTK